MSASTDERTPFRPGDFFYLRSYYWQTRQWHYLRQGLPAVIVGCVILLPILLADFSTSDSTERYRVAFNRAVRNQDYETAYLFRKKLESLADDTLSDEEFRFNCAVADIGRGQVNQGIAIINELAPAESFGYGPAHLWLARQQIGEDPAPAGESQAQTIHHLQGALQGDSKNPSIHLALGHHYFRAQNREKAIKHLTVAAQTQPQLNFILASLHEAGGDQDRTNEHYQLAADALRKAIDENADNLEARINLAVCHNKLGNFTEAVRTLVEGLNGATEEDRAVLIPVLSSLYLAESDRLRREVDPDHPDYAKSLLLLSKALEFAPNHEGAINRIADLASHEGEASEKAIETLKKLIAAGKMTALAHVILGTSSLQKGDPVKAKFHYGHAYRLDPQMPILLNNVAWMLAHQEDPQLPKALAVVNQAMENLAPEDPLYPAVIDTRGRIYVKMKRWKEALVDLESALKSLPPDRDLHLALSATYQALGDEQLAVEHRRIADGIR